MEIALPSITIGVSSGAITVGMVYASIRLYSYFWGEENETCKEKHLKLLDDRVGAETTEATGDIKEDVKEIKNIATNNQEKLMEVSEVVAGVKGELKRMNGGNK